LIGTLIQLLKTGNATQRDLFPDLPKYNRGLPRVTGAECKARDGCRACMDVCPTNAIEVIPIKAASHVSLDLGKCIACGECTSICPAGTLVEDWRTKVAVRNREELVLCNDPPDRSFTARVESSPFRRSIHLREVSTGDNASDLEIAAANNPIFDASRFGINFVASPRFADALIVTGPVARAMREPLQRCFDAMAEPRLVIAAGVSAISGGIHCGGYATANGIGDLLPVAVYVPGNPPHPWYILHAILLAMGHPAAL
jgi:Ni,Fe-hydrogenase III small subunit/NAD-dependent dihydropyrimidine dehydrogenase PreA subunit